MNQRARRWLALAAGAMVLAAPSTAHADAAGPSDWRSEIVSVVPATESFTATIEGGDSFLRIVVELGHEVIVEGYADEPYLWIDTDGAVHENVHSPATYYNRSRSGVASLPPEADASAEPDWKVVGDGGAWAWHDHRAHWMGVGAPPGMKAGESLPPQTVPLTVDGVPTDITVVLTLEGSPSPWAAIAGALIGLGLAGATVMPRRRIPVTTAIIPIAAAASTIGLMQYMSLPAETGPRLIWWIPPVVALACGVALVFVRATAPFARGALSLIAASQLVIWGWDRRDGMTKSVLPTSAPFWLDRMVTAAALTAGAVLLVATVVDLVRLYVSAPKAQPAKPTQARP